ncbi:MAG: recombination mediator RecR [Bacteroidia bacterium]
MQYPSKLIEEAVNEFMRLPGIGKKTATRLVLSLVKQRPAEISHFSGILQKLSENLKHCQVCHNLTDDDICAICGNPYRDGSVLCIVEDVRDVLAIENTGQYRGKYHVLNGLISPMDGIGPDDINVNNLIVRIEEEKVGEIIFALSATMEGDTTMFYISKKTQPMDIRISTLSRGIAVGGELEYADEITLGRSIITRIPYSV